MDIDECKIPEELTAADIVPRIRQKLLDVGLRGPPASIRIYGDLTGLDFQSPDLKLNQFHAGHVNIYIYIYIKFASLSNLFCFIINLFLLITVFYRRETC